MLHTPEPIYTLSTLLSNSPQINLTRLRAYMHHYVLTATNAIPLSLATKTARVGAHVNSERPQNPGQVKGGKTWPLQYCTVFINYSNH